METDVVLREEIRDRYAKAAAGGSCCDSDCCNPDPGLAVDVGAGSYSQSELASIPDAAAGASLGVWEPHRRGRPRRG